MKMRRIHFVCQITKATDTHTHTHTRHTHTHTHATHTHTHTLRICNTFYLNYTKKFYAKASRFYIYMDIVPLAILSLLLPVALCHYDNRNSLIIKMIRYGLGS